MKLLTLNFLTCARKTCKAAPAAFPLHPRDAELERADIDLNPLFLKNMLPRLEWEAMKTLTTELGLPSLPADPPSETDLFENSEEPTQMLRDLHQVLLETSISSGQLVCGNCQHVYAVKEGIANFLLPSHMV